MDAGPELRNGYACSSDFNAANITLKDIDEESSAVREARISLFKNMTIAMTAFEISPERKYTVPVA